MQGQELLVFWKEGLCWISDKDGVFKDLPGAGRYAPLFRGSRGEVSVWLVVSLDMKKMELLVDKGRNLRLGVRYT